LLNIVFERPPAGSKTTAGWFSVFGDGKSPFEVLPVRVRAEYINQRLISNRPTPVSGSRTSTHSPALKIWGSDAMGALIPFSLRLITLEAIFNVVFATAFCRDRYCCNIFSMYVKFIRINAET
jgi:hypothetical protein